jgi:uncharacterized protein (TIGR02147 family)
MYSARDYREYLQGRVDKSGERGIITRMAQALRCQRSHISRVLSGRLHLTMDQAFHMTRFWQMNPEDEQYFMKMVERDRAGDPEYRKKLDKELEAFRESQADISKRLGRSSIAVIEQQNLYYSAWYWSAIHVLVSIPEFQKVPAIARRLNLPEELVLTCLRALESLGLVAHQRDTWKFFSASLHLSKDSPMNPIQHGNWRSRAVMCSQRPGEDGVHYTVVQSVSQTDFLKIKELCLKTIDQYAAIAAPSQEEELVCFDLDFFRV